MTDTDTPDIRTAEGMLIEFLTQSQRNIRAMFGQDDDDKRLTHVLLAIPNQATAYLLDALVTYAPHVADMVAAELHDMLDDGQNMAEWIWEQLNSRGIDVDGIEAAELPGAKKAVPFVSASPGTTGHVLAQEVAAQRAAADEIMRNTPPLVAGTPVEAGKSYVITGGFTVPVVPADETEPDLPEDIGPND